MRAQPMYWRGGKLEGNGLLLAITRAFEMANGWWEVLPEIRKEIRKACWPSQYVDVEKNIDVLLSDKDAYYENNRYEFQRLCQRELKEQ